MYKVGDKVIVTAIWWLRFNPEYRNKVFTVCEEPSEEFDIVSQTIKKRYRIKYKDFSVSGSVSVDFNPFKKLSTLLSEYLESIKKGA